MYGLYGFLNKKLYGLYGFFFRKLYGFLLKIYGFFQKSVGHPAFKKKKQLKISVGIIFEEHNLIKND